MTQHYDQRMLAPVWTDISRREFLLFTIGAFAAVGCTRQPVRAAEPATPESRPRFDSWTAEARGMLTDSLQALRTFDVFAAYRIARSNSTSSLRMASELAWDPPTSAAWDDATHVTRGLHGRADQLYQAVTSAQVDESLWREQRALADGAHDLRDLGDVLLAYRDRVDGLGPGDASGALDLLDRAWLQWESTAGRFGVSRAEAIGCS